MWSKVWERSEFQDLEDSIVGSLNVVDASSLTGVSY